MQKCRLGGKVLKLQTSIATSAQLVNRRKHEIDITACLQICIVELAASERRCAVQVWP